MVILDSVQDPNSPIKNPGPRPVPSLEDARTPRGMLRWHYAWVILKRHFSENQLLLRGAALTYATLLSSVPFLAVVLSLLRALGVEEQFLPFLVDRLQIGGEQPAEIILSTAKSLHPAALGAAGAIGLLFAALLLLAQVDSTFNAIWGVRENRPLMARLVGYGGLLIVGPLWIALWTSAVSSFKLAAAAWPGALSEMGLTVAQIGGPLLIFLVLTALYTVTPNTHVRLRAAVAGAVLATLMLEVSQILFVTWVKTSVAYDIVYGTFAALPIFLAWIYLNWLTVLLGAEAAYLTQNMPTWLSEAEEPQSLAWDERERLVLASAALLAASSDEIPVDRLAHELGVSPRLVHRPLDDLEDSGWIVPVHDSRGQVSAYRAQSKLQGVTLADVRRSLRALGGKSAIGSRQRALRTTPAWMAVLEPLERDGDRPFEAITPIDLAKLLNKNAQDPQARQL